MSPSRLESKESTQVNPADDASKNAKAVPVVHAESVPVKKGKNDHQAKLDKLTKDRECILNCWPDSKGLGLQPEEVALNTFLRKNLKFLFGQTGFNPPVPARNPVSVTMHNPRFSASLWALNTEAYQRKGHISRSLKEVVALGVSIANRCPHCAFIHTAFGPAAGSDVSFDEMQVLYQTEDPMIAFKEDADPLAPGLAAWALAHRNGEARIKNVPVPAEMIPEVMGTMVLFAMYNRIVDAFVSQQESGPMFPLPVRVLMKFPSLAPLVQRMMSGMMTWLMYSEDEKVQEGKVLRDINKVAPIVRGVEGFQEEPAQELSEEFKWAAGEEVIRTTMAFLAAEAEHMSSEFVPSPLRTYFLYWITCWDGARSSSKDMEEWIEMEVTKSMFDLTDDAGSVVMLRILLVTVVASYEINDSLLSNCQAYHGVRGTHAAVMWAAFLAAERTCALVGGKEPEES